VTRRSWILAASAAAAASSKGQVCTGAPIPAGSMLFPKGLQNPPSDTLFDLPDYDSLPFPAKLSIPGTRLPVNQMTQPANAQALGLLRAAYQRMIVDPSVKGFAVQATLHKLFCSTSYGDAHGYTGGAFLAWHRAFLYFHERVLRWQLEQVGIANADAVRLPYWDVISFSESGGIYGSYPELENASCRQWTCPDACTATEAVGQLRLAQNETDLANCAGELYSWHLAVHNYVGGYMGSITQSAFDPIFFALHASVDRMWSNSKATATPDKHICTFYDPYAGNGAWVQVNLADYGATANPEITYAPPGGVSAMFLALPVPAAMEVTLPTVVTAGTKLFVVGPKKEYSLGIVLPSDAQHSHQHQPTRFAIQPELEGVLKENKHDNVQLFLKDSRGVKRPIEGSRWRLVPRG
jgi:hypothetical protein